MELMTPPENVHDNPLYSGPLLDSIVRMLSVREEKVTRRKLRELRTNMRLEVQRLQKNDLIDCDNYFRMILQTTECPMTIQMLGVIQRQIRFSILRAHASINFEFKILPQIERQRSYSDHIRMVKFGWTITNFVKNDSVQDNYYVL